MCCGAKGLLSLRSVGKHTFGSHSSVRPAKAASATSHRLVRCTRRTCMGGIWRDLSECLQDFWRAATYHGAAGRKRLGRGPLTSLLLVIFPLQVCSGMSEDPQNFHYTHLWVSSDGETHITEAKLTGFDLKKYAVGGEPQFVKQGPSPSKVVFTELAPGLENDYHSAPQVQFVITVAGKWKIKTTDGSEKVFVPGDILFQDDTEKSPAKKVPKHWSGVVGDEPNQQVIIQVDRKPEVDNPAPGTL